MEVHLGKKRRGICSRHSEESNVYVWGPTGTSDPLSRERVCAPACLMCESLWDMGTFCKSVLSQFVSEHNFASCIRNGIATGEKRKIYVLQRRAHTQTCKNKCRWWEQRINATCLLLLFPPSVKSTPVCCVSFFSSSTGTTVWQFCDIKVKFSFDMCCAAFEKRLICCIWVETNRIIRARLS